MLRKFVLIPLVFFFWLTTGRFDQSREMKTAVEVHMHVAWGEAVASERVPFVACEFDGQGGPLPGPKDSGRVLSAPQSVVRSLAYYASAALGVLAPRGWHCFGRYGSSGLNFFVTPELHTADDFLKPNSNLTGPAIQLSFSSSHTFGRFFVARVAARLFPTKKKFVQRVIHEGIAGIAEPESDFPNGPYPTDILTRRSDSEVEFETPANTDGMGTESRLVKNSSPIKGVAIMTADEDLILLAVRMPPELSNLVPSIVGETRRTSSYISARQR